MDLDSRKNLNEAIAESEDEYKDNFEYLLNQVDECREDQDITKKEIGEQLDDERMYYNFVTDDRVFVVDFIRVLGVLHDVDDIEEYTENMIESIESHFDQFTNTGIDIDYISSSIDIDMDIENMKLQDYVHLITVMIKYYNKSSDSNIDITNELDMLIDKKSF